MKNFQFPIFNFQFLCLWLALAAPAAETLTIGLTRTSAGYVASFLPTNSLGGVRLTDVLVHNAAGSNTVYVWLFDSAVPAAPGWVPGTFATNQFTGTTNQTTWTNGTPARVGDTPQRVFLKRLDAANWTIHSTRAGALAGTGQLTYSSATNTLHVCDWIEFPPIQVTAASAQGAFWTATGRYFDSGIYAVLSTSDLSLIPAAASCVIELTFKQP